MRSYPPYPRIMRCPDGQYELMEYWVPPKGTPVIQGFVFDGVSSPRFLEMFGIGNEQPNQIPAAMVHDFEYSQLSTVPRYLADLHFYANLRAFGVDSITARAMFAAVRLLGEGHYQGHASRN